MINYQITSNHGKTVMMHARTLSTKTKVFTEMHQTRKWSIKIYSLNLFTIGEIVKILDAFNDNKFG